jgi:DNA-binding transcriptional MerR regulator
MSAEGLLRVGELSRRSGVSADLLRAWERRYGLLEPERSAGGLRLYSPTDLERVRLMKQHLASGLAAAEAAALALRDQGTASVVRPPAVRAELAEALEAFDEPRAQAVLDRLLTSTTVDTLLREIVLPYLDDLGDRWERGAASVAQEHFASGVLRGRLLALARGWGMGMRIVYLGPNCPIDTVAETARLVDATLIVLSGVDAGRASRVTGALKELAARHRLALGGTAAAAVDAELEEAGVLALGGDVVAEAARVTSAVSLS